MDRDVRKHFLVADLVTASRTRRLDVRNRHIEELLPWASYLFVHVWSKVSLNPPIGEFCRFPHGERIRRTWHRFLRGIRRKVVAVDHCLLWICTLPASHGLGRRVRRLHDVNKQVRNLLSISIYSQKVGRAFNSFRSDYECWIESDREQRIQLSGVQGSRMRIGGGDFSPYRNTRRHFDIVSRLRYLRSNVWRGKGILRAGLASRAGRRARRRVAAQQPGLAGPKPRSTIEPQDRSTRVSSSFGSTASCLKGAHSVVWAKAPPVLEHERKAEELQAVLRACHTLAGASRYGSLYPKGCSARCFLRTCSLLLAGVAGLHRPLNGPGFEVRPRNISGSPLLTLALSLSLMAGLAALVFVACAGLQ